MYVCIYIYIYTYIHTYVYAPIIRIPQIYKSIISRLGSAPALPAPGPLFAPGPPLRRQEKEVELCILYTNKTRAGGSFFPYLNITIFGLSKYGIFKTAQGGTRIQNIEIAPRRVCGHLFPTCVC